MKLLIVESVFDGLLSRPSISPRILILCAIILEGPFFLLLILVLSIFFGNSWVEFYWYLGCFCSYECKLCLTLHNNEGNYLAHTQGKRHQTNLAKRAAREAKEAPAQPQPHKRKVSVRKTGKLLCPSPLCIYVIRINCDWGWTVSLLLLLCNPSEGSLPS